VNYKMLALYGLKWNPFTPNVPTEALHVTTRLESFCWRVQQLAGDGGFALVTGVPGCGKSAALRILTASLATQRDVTVGRDQSAAGQHRRLLSRDGRPFRRRTASAQSLGWCQDLAPALAGSHPKHPVQTSASRSVRPIPRRQGEELLEARHRPLPPRHRRSPTVV
jgi:hypothetical protein